MMPVIVYVPKDTSYLAEFINDFLKVYNTVGIQIENDCYVMKLEQPLQNQSIGWQYVKESEGK